MNISGKMVRISIIICDILSLMGFRKSDKTTRLYKWLRNNWLFLCILGITVGLRAYRLETLTTFGRDQGIDFASVYDILINKNLTLIGIKTSIGDFFQGPLYLYSLVPFFIYRDPTT